LADAVFGALLYLTGIVSWAVYGLGRLLGAPSIHEFAIWHGNRWSMSLDLTGDSAFTINDVWLWAGWVAYAPGDLIIQMFLGHSIGNFFELTSASFGGTGSALVSLLSWFLFPWLVTVRRRD
jgi:hypothetical protein